MARRVLMSLAVFFGLLLLTTVLSGGRFMFGLFILPLGLLPMLLRRNRPK